jgi:hypothetical protein
MDNVRSFGLLTKTVGVEHKPSEETGDRLSNDGFAMHGPFLLGK